MDLRKILIINPYGIGDVLFTTPVISNLRLAYPAAEIAYLCNRRTSEFLKFNPDIAKVFIYERDEFVESGRQNPFLFVQKWAEFFAAIRGERFDVAFDFSLNSTFGFLAAACGIPKRVGFDHKKRGRFLTDRIPLPGFEEKHVVEYYLDLLRLVGVPVTVKHMKLDVPSQHREWAGQWLKKHGLDPSARPLVAVLPGGGSSWGKSAGLKRWPSSKYAHLMDKIVENFDAAVILLGEAQERKLCGEVASEARFPLYSAVGETSVLGLAAFFMQARVAILNDGGPLHVAQAVGARTVSIFGPVDPKVYGPYPTANHTVVQKGLPCQPCYRRFRMARCGHISCLGELSVEEVYAKIKGIL